MHHAVGIKHTHQTNTVKVQSLGNHLCSNQDIGLSFFELTDDGFIPGFRTCCIQVHSLDMSLRKVKLQFLFQFLGAIAGREQTFRGA